MNKKEMRHRLENIAKELQVLFEVLEADEPRFPDEAQELVDKGICLECKKPITEGQKNVRGLHESCRKTLKVRLKQLGQTDDFAISQGWLKPESAGGRPFKQTASLQHMLKKQERQVTQQEQKNAADTGKTSSKRGQRGSGT